MLCFSSSTFYLLRDLHKIPITTLVQNHFSRLRNPQLNSIKSRSLTCFHQSPGFIACCPTSYSSPPRKNGQWKRHRPLYSDSLSIYSPVLPLNTLINKERAQTGNELACAICLSSSLRRTLFIRRPYIRFPIRSVAPYHRSTVGRYGT